jgi:hypothetical protein
MNTSLRILAAAAFGACLSGTCAAQSVIHPSHRFSWQENCGWMNWKGAGLNAQGVAVASTYLQGYIWCENVGWVCVGHSPANGFHHGNTNGLDYGVNIGPGGLLSGFAWGENIGWINFGGGALASPANPALLDSAWSRFRGYAWAENVGWINLDDLNHYVGFSCVADMDDGQESGIPDGGVGIEDLLYYLGQYDQGTPRADVDDGQATGIPDGGVGIEDLLYFLSRYDAGC